MDSETGLPLPSTGGAGPGGLPTTVSVLGPYAYGSEGFLLADIYRMNLFRQAEIHCIGIGEFSPWLLEEIARLGHGEARGAGIAGRVVK